MKITYPATRTGQLLTFAAATLMVSSAYAQETALPVIPGATGFGIMTKAGRGGPIIKVINLNDSGAGSLRAALEATGKRTVIFEVSGTIELKTPITIRSGNLTVAGQTAPGLGILVKGRGIFIGASDVLFQHIAIRPGDEPNEDPDPVVRQKEQDNRDALDISADPVNANPADPVNTTQRVVVDHVSLSWSIDEVFTTWGSTNATTHARSFVKECTISNSIFSEALNHSLHSHGPHPMGVLIGSDSSSISLHRNLLAHLGDRNPLLADDVSTVQVANNYIYRPGETASNRMKLAVGGDFNSSMLASFKTNVMMPDPNIAGSSTRYMLVTNRNPPQSGIPQPALTLFMDGNRIYNFKSASWWPSPITSQTDNATVFDDHTFTGGKTYLIGPNDAEPSIFTTTNVNVPIIAWDALEAHVLKNAGSRPFYRDPVDARIIDQVTNRTGGLIDSPSQPEVGGYPNIPELHVTHNAPSTDADSDDDGYTDLEEWLQGKARQVELGVPAPPAITTIAPAAAPNNINQINLTWTDVPNETGYRIERKRGLNGTYAEIATTAANVTSYNDGYLGTGTQYYYRVLAYNTRGDSGPSTDMSATTAEIAGRAAHWKFDDATGLTAADSSGNANTGTLQLGPTWVPGKIGTGLNFDGSPTGGDDKVNAGNGPAVNNLGAMTVAAWINVETVGEAGNPGRIVHKATGTAPVNGWQFCTQGSNQIGFAVDYDGTDLVRTSAADAITLGSWHHVVVTWDGTNNATNVLMYVDGTAVGSYAATTNASGNRVNDSGASIYLGNEPNSTRTLDGVLDDVRVYNRVLSPAEIKAIHRAGL
jgi:hypothetical protein